MRECLVVEGLRKTYENGFQAVNNLCCKMFKDQIFCLLGHNGAGKTSTISILTGLIEPSSYGKLEVFGVDIMSQ
jgi:ATP-binding cassette subfamily A (ABC1) protein 3